MYCINCGVKLADTETKCPLCGTAVYHPDMPLPAAQPLYPPRRMPVGSSSKVLCGALIIVFLIPLAVCLFADVQLNGTLDWFGYVAGALLLAYTAFALPLWFKKPNPVIFVPCSFLAAALYLMYIDLETGGSWFLPFALPVVGGLGLVTTAVVTLLYYLKRGRLYILGGACMALGAFMPLIEFLLTVAFPIGFMGWSVYPLAVLFLLGGLLIYFAISASAREMIERKLFF